MQPFVELVVAVLELPTMLGRVLHQQLADGSGRVQQQAYADWAARQSIYLQRCVWGANSAGGGERGARQTAACLPACLSAWFGLVVLRRPSVRM